MLLQWQTGLCPAPTPAQVHTWGILSRKKEGLGCRRNYYLLLPSALRWRPNSDGLGCPWSCQHRQGRGLHVALCRNPRTWSDAWRLVGAPYLFTAAPAKVCLSRLLLLQQVAPGTRQVRGQKCTFTSQLWHMLACWGWPHQNTPLHAPLTRGLGEL